MPKEGQTLQVSAGSWSPTPAAVGYQWQRCNPNGRLCTPIPGATASTYAVTAADTGHALARRRPRDGGSRLPGRAQRRDSRGRHRADDGPVDKALPTVAGTSQQGKQLTGSTGSWSGSGAIGYGYQWYRCDAAGAHCKSVHGATKPTYTLVAKDAGQTLGFAVHATDATGTATAYASLVGPVAGSRRHPRLDGATDDRGRRQAGPDAPGLRRQLEPDAGLAHLRVAAVQPERPPLHPDRRRDGRAPTPSRPPTPAMRCSRSSRLGRTASRRRR